MSRRLYVSDVHLDPDDHQRLAAFTGLLRSRATQFDEIYLLGDICEMWIGDDDDSPLVAQLAKLFTDLQETAHLFFMAGNRDFLLGKAFAQRTGLTLLDDACALADGTLLSHGDALCTDDTAYQQMRLLLRSPEWQKDILGKSLAERRAFGRGLREQSKSANANKAGNIMDVNPQQVTDLMANHQTSVLVHGHTHRPGIHLTANGGRRVVLGSWERCGWWAEQNDGNVTLRCARLQDLQ